MKKIFVACLLAVGLVGNAEEYRIGLAGNGYVTEAREGARIMRDGLSRWHSQESVVSVYFYVNQPSKAELALSARGNSEIRVMYGEQHFDVKLQSEDFVRVPVGEINIAEPGYARVDLQGISKSGRGFGEVQHLILDGVEGECFYVADDFSDHFGRRGPSVHMAFPLPKGDTEWFYNEVTVPEVGEVMHSYYMTAGFGEGYFGMQYNSPTSRHVLFSVWSPFNTQNPRDIPEELRIKLLRQGEGVHIGEFGNEGSGGQSYLNYPWKSGETYKFLMRVRPDGKGNTTYTAYFYATDEKQWRLIAEFLRPQTDTWYSHAHCFLENFNPEQGYLSREVMFGNQWARSKEGEWTRLTKAMFTHDDTGRARMRLDYQGGETGDNRYYLKMGGFFSDSTPYGSRFSTQPAGNEPDIDFEALEKL